MPRGFFFVWAGLALVLIWPRAQVFLSDLLSRRVPSLLFERRVTGIAVLALLAIVFWILRERSFFMGDGYLIGELVDRGAPFRAFDNLDYLLHHQLHQLLRAAMPIDSFTLYQIGSVVAGVVGAWILARLTAKLGWEPWRRALLLLFVFTTGPAVLFYGYVESYSFLFVFLTAFLLSGYLALEERAPLWVASLFYGLALAFHLTALFSAPAMLYLALRSRAKPASRRWMEAVLPALLLFLLSVVVHLAAGYNERWFRKEFIDAKNTKSIWIPLLEPQRGFLSLYHWKDLVNLALLTAPLCLAVVLARMPWLRARWKRPEIGFLLVQMAGVLFFTLALDRKLGGARDWDLLAAHAGGLMLLAAVAFPAGPTPEGKRTAYLPAPREAGLAWGAMLVVFLPWVLLLHMETRSIARFVDIASDFPNFARAYAYEEVGKYYRKRSDLPRAEEMYERCVDSYPKNPRFLLLLGSIYFAQNRLDDAERLYQQALDITPDHRVGLEMMGKVKMKRAEGMTPGPAREAMFGQAADNFAKLVQQVTDNAEDWGLYGFTALRAERLPEAVNAYQHALSIAPNGEALRGLATAMIRLERYADALPLLRQAMAQGERSTTIERGVAICLLGLVRDSVIAGRAPEPVQVAELDALLSRLRAGDPDDATVAEFIRRLELLRRGIDPDRGGSAPSPGIEEGEPGELSPSGSRNAGDPGSEP